MDGAIAKMFSARDSCEKGLNELYHQIDEAIKNKVRRVRVEGLVKVNKCRETMLVAISENDQLLELAAAADETEKITELLVTWQRNLNLKHDQCMDRARLYIDSVEETTSARQSAGSSQKISHKASSSRHGSKSASTTSSRRRKEARLATLRREEIERQNAANIRLAEQKFYIEQQKHRVDLEAIEEENQRRLAEARLLELELSEEPLDSPSPMTGSSQVDAVDDADRIQNWVDGTSFDNAQHDPPASTHADAQVTADLGASHSLFQEQSVALVPPITIQASYNAPTSLGDQNTWSHPLLQAGSTTSIVTVPSSSALPQRVTHSNYPSREFTPKSVASTSTPALPPATSQPPGPCSSNLPPKIPSSAFLPQPVSVTSTPAIVSAQPPACASFTLPPRVPRYPPASAIAELPVSGGVSSNPFPNSTFPIVLPTFQPVLPSCTPAFPPASPGLVNCIPFPSSATHLGGASPFPFATYVNPASHFQPAPSAHNHFTSTIPTHAPLPPFVGTEHYGHGAPQPSVFPHPSLSNIQSNERSPAVAETAPPSGAATIQELAEVLMLNRKDPLPEWKLSQFNGDPLNWHEWFGQFRSAIDSQRLSDDVKLTYLKTLVTGKAKSAIAEFAYCGAMYTDALKTLERKFGQPQTIVSAHMEKLANFPPLKMHSSDNVISFSTMISSLVGVFKSLSFHSDLKGSALLTQAIQKLPPNMKESWSRHTVKRHLARFQRLAETGG